MTFCNNNNLCTKCYLNIVEIVPDEMEGYNVLAMRMNCIICV